MALDVGEGRPALGQQVLETLDDGPRGVPRRGQPLVDTDDAATLGKEREVREGAADVDSNPIGHEIRTVRTS